MLLTEGIKTNLNHIYFNKRRTEINNKINLVNLDKSVNLPFDGQDYENSFLSSSKNEILDSNENNKYFNDKTQMIQSRISEFRPIVSKPVYVVNENNNNQAFKENNQFRQNNQAIPVLQQSNEVNQITQNSIQNQNSFVKNNKNKEEEGNEVEDEGFLQLKEKYKSSVGVEGRNNSFNYLKSALDSLDKQLTKIKFDMLYKS